jgi:hypothetical protein
MAHSVSSGGQAMSVFFPHLRVGEPVRCQALSVFPLFDGQQVPLEYLLSDEGIGSGSVTVEEVSEGGSVPNLIVENKGDIRVLFLEGEQLIGAKQNRILNTSVLIAAKSKVKIPVSCVEQGRWRYRSKHFGSSGSHSPSKLRYLLKASVSYSLKEKLGHMSDQGKVWAEVARQQKSLGASSGTTAMSDTFDSYKEQVAGFQEKLRYVDGATGIAVAIGKKIVAADIFDKPSTCGKVWDRLMSGYVLDALEEQADDGLAETADVVQLLGVADALPWEQADPVGEGEEYRAHQGEEIHASALTLRDAPVHVSVMVAG